MAVTVLGAGTMVTSAGTALSPAPPASTAADDIAIVSIWDDEATTTYTITAGWQHVSTAHGLASGAFKGAAFWFRSTGTVPTPSITKPGSAQWGAVCVVYRGVRTIGAPWSVTPTYSANASSTTCTATTITPYWNGSRIVMVGFHSVDSAAAQGSSYAATSPSSLTEDTDQSTASGTGGGIFSASADQTTAGATGNATATIGTASLNVGLLLDLVPESAMTITRGKQFTGTIGVTGLTVAATVPSGGCAVGTKLVVGVVIGNASQTCTVADNAAGSTNVYTLIQNSGSALSSVGLALFYCDLTTALAASDVVTATTSANSLKAIECYQMLGADTDYDVVSAVVDVAAAGAGSTVDPNSITTTRDGDAVFVFTGSAGTPVIQFPSSLYSNEAGVASTGTVRTLDFETRIANAAGVEDPATLTWSAASVAVLATTVAFDVPAGAAAAIPFVVMAPPIPT